MDFIHHIKINKPVTNIFTSFNKLLLIKKTNKQKRLLNLVWEMKSPDDLEKAEQAVWQCIVLEQGSSNLTLEVQSAAEFSSNPDQTHLPVIF